MLKREAALGAAGRDSPAGSSYSAFGFCYQGTVFTPSYSML